MSNELQTVQKALDYIENHIYETISELNIAQACGLSVRHLYRLFTEYTGSTLKHYLRSRRLTLASQVLIQSDASIIDVAFTHQFQSPEVFTRAFRRAFWVTPSQYRKIGCQHNITQQPHISSDLLKHARKMAGFTPTIKRIDGKTFCGIRKYQRNYGLRTPQNWHEVQTQMTRLLGISPSKSIWQMFARKAHDRLSSFDTVECTIGFLQSGNSDKKIDEDPHWICDQIPSISYAQFPYEDTTVPYELMLQHAYKWLRNSRFGHADAPTLFQSTSQCGRLGFLLLPITDQKTSKHMVWWNGYEAVLSTALGPSDNS